MTDAFHLPRGFRYGGVACHIKASHQPDLAIIASDQPCTAAGVYTQNLICAPPVHLDRARTPMDDCLAVVVNSGNANACTGQQGMEDARQMTRWTAEAIGAQPEQVLVMSTGIIGHHLPMDKVRNGIASAASSLGPTVSDFEAAARAILTTDRGIKTGSRQVGEGVVAGMAKGAGMIGPNMATMLAVLATDFELRPEQAQQLLQSAMEISFNCIRVEGHTSTNDTALLLASGAAGPIDDIDPLQQALNDLSIDLAKMIPADGEGASHLMEVRVVGCPDNSSARQIAEAVADSPLVKTAATGNDPNWGRIVSAAGYAGVPFDVNSLCLTLNGFELFRHGEPVAYDEKQASMAMKKSLEVDILLTVGNGPGQCTVWASDLTVDYVRFNSEYTT